MTRQTTTDVAKTEQATCRVTRQTTTAVTRKAALQVSEPARRAVLDTIELLETIFEFLPERDLICVNAVCRRFKDAIDESTFLQKKLFLLADPHADATTPRHNNMIFDSDRADPEPEHSNNIQTYDFVRRLPGGWFTPQIPDEVRFRLMVPQRVLIGEDFKEKKELDWREGMSCDNMFLTQPPVEKVRLSMGAGPVLYWGRHRTVDLKIKGGVRFGDVRVFLAKWLKVLNARRSTHPMYFISTKSWIDVRYESAKDDWVTDHWVKHAMYRLERHPEHDPLSDSDDVSDTESDY